MPLEQHKDWNAEVLEWEAQRLERDERAAVCRSPAETSV